MKKTFSIALISIGLALLVSCGANRDLSRALSDIKNNKVTRTTISRLEAASLTTGNEAESYLNLARIYQFNPQYSNPEQARFYYQKVLSMYQMSNYTGQLKKLKKSYGVDALNLRNTIRDVDELICNKAFSAVLKENTFNGYVKFVKKYPNSTLVNAAKDKALALKQSQNTIAGYAEYLRTFPDYRSDKVKQLALNVAKSKGNINDYIVFVNNFAESIDNVASLNLPFFQNTNDYVKVFNQALKNKSAETKNRFTDQFLSVQYNYCKGNSQRIKDFCKGSPINIELTNGQKNTIKNLMRSIKSNNLVFYLTNKQGFILHDGNQFYEGDIKSGIREGWGNDYYPNGDHYSGGFSNGKYNGNGTYFHNDGWSEMLTWNNGVKEGYCIMRKEESRRHSFELTGNYLHGQRVGEWTYFECYESTGLVGQIFSALEKTYCDKTIYQYSNGILTNTRTVSRNLTEYRRNSREYYQHLEYLNSINENDIMNYVENVTLKENEDWRITYNVKFKNGKQGEIFYSKVDSWIPSLTKNTWYYCSSGFWISADSNSKTGAILNLFKELEK